MDFLFRSLLPRTSTRVSRQALLLRHALRRVSDVRQVTWENLAPAVMDGHPLPFSQVIDVRTRDEFEKNCIPGAINLPILSKTERERVGVTYVASPFEGRRLGAGLLCKNLGSHLESFFADKTADYEPLIYCARGGLRSHGVATVLKAIGFNVTVLDGGYRSYRTWVRQQLESLPKMFEFHVITGCTGCAKSRLLDLLLEDGHQVLHLEAIAKHKGSVLGPYPDSPQPSQRAFDAAVVKTLWRLGTDRPVWLEDESRSIGTCHLSKAMWEAKTAAKHVRIECPAELRAEFILKDYDYLTADPKLLKTRLDWLAKVQPKDRIEHWMTLVDSGDFVALVSDLLHQHYDPLYRKSRASTFASPLTKVVTVAPPNSLLDDNFLATVVVPKMIAAMQDRKRKNKKL